MDVLLAATDPRLTRWQGRLASFVAILLCTAPPGFVSARAQIAMSVGNYGQNFDVLGTSAANWTNDTTLPAWYSAKGDGDSTNYLADTGSNTAGGLRSYGGAGSHNPADRALGSLAASGITYAYGARFLNDTAVTQTNITVSYTGEQWRSGSTTNAQTLAFAWAVGSSPITNAIAAVTWAAFPPLDFVSPNLSAATASLDGNAASNRRVFAGSVLTGVAVAPGQELFLRWLDVDDGGFDNGLAIDDLLVSFGTNPPTGNSPPLITTQPQSQTIAAGADVTFTVAATGRPSPTYQWQLNGASLTGETNSSLTLLGVTTNHAGVYTVALTNAAGFTNSQPANLTVFPAVSGFSLLTYNTHGNFINDWTTNSPQV